MNPVLRTLQRYAIPRFVASIVFFLRDRVKISLSSKVQLTSQIRFGKKSVVKPYSIIQTSGASITFGKGCAISSFNHVSAVSANIIIGDYVRTGTHVTIVATTRKYADKDRLIIDQGYSDRGIIIGNDVLIGSGSVLVDGCEIGDGAVIGAGSIVTGKVAPYSVIFGSPPRVIMWRR